VDTASTPPGVLTLYSKEVFHPLLDEPRRIKPRNSRMDHRIRVLVAKPGLDGHDRGAKVIARALRDAGMEVVYTGLRQTPEMIVNAALQEDVQVIGLSILSGAHNAIVPRVMELLKEKQMTDVVVIVGGIVPDEDAAQLKRLGVAAVFQPGASLEGIVEFIRSAVKQAA
jgi:methylmalonyl-CoA mutase C-terminal domain/subunit